MTPASPGFPSPPAAGPSRLRRWGIRAGIALLLLAVTAWGLFTWLFHDPFEGDVESLDRCIPTASTFAFRGSAEEILASPFVRDRVLGREDVAALLEAWGVEAALRRLEEEERLLDARLPGFLAGVRLRTDLLGRETVVFGGPSPGRVILAEDPLDARVAVATRVSARARRLLSLLKHDWVRRRIEADSGVRVTRHSNAYAVDLASVSLHPEWETVYAALVKDVLVAGNDRDLVIEAVHLAATGGGGSLPYRLDAGLAFGEGAGAPLRAFVDLARAASSAEEAGEPTPGDLLRESPGVLGMIGPLLDVDNLASGQARISFPSPDEARLEAVASRAAGGLSSLAADLVEGAPRPPAESLAEAALLAPAGSAVLAARLEARPGTLVKVLEARADESLRKELDGVLKEGGTGIAEIAAEIDDYLARGFSVVVERLPECDGIDLDVPGADPQGRFVLPLPGVLLALRQKREIPEGGAEKMIRRRLGEWRGNLSVLEDLEGLPAGVRGLRFRPKFLTAEKELVRPAAAFEGDLVLLSSNEGTLRRALEARGGKRPALSDFPGFAEACSQGAEGQAALFLEAGAALAMARDGRREAANGAIAKDPVKERRRIHTEVAKDFMRGQQQIAQKELQAEVDRRFDEWEREQREVAFPAAVKDYLRSLEGWRGVSSVAGFLAWDETGPRGSLLLRAGDAR